MLLFPLLTNFGAYFLWLLQQSWKSFLSFELALLILLQISITLLYVLVVHKSLVEGFHIRAFEYDKGSISPLEGFFLQTNAVTFLMMDLMCKLDLDEVVVCDWSYSVLCSQCSGGALSSLFQQLNAYLSPKQFVLSVFF